MRPDWLPQLEFKNYSQVGEAPPEGATLPSEWSDPAVVVHWFWNSEEVSGPQYDETYNESQWMAHERTVIFGENATPNPSEALGTRALNTRVTPVAFEELNRRNIELTEVPVEPVRDAISKRTEFSYSYNNLSQQRARTDGGSPIPDVIKPLTNALSLQKSDWVELFSKETIGDIWQGQVPELFYRIEEVGEATVHKISNVFSSASDGATVLSKEDAVKAEKLLKHQKSDLALGHGNDRYSGPLFAYRQLRSWKNDVVGYEFASPINVVWQRTEKAMSVNQVASGFKNNGWTVSSLPSGNRYVVLDDDGGVNEHNEEAERTKSVELWNPTKQYHVRLFEVKGTDSKHEVVGQAHCDPFLHGLLDGESCWEFETMRDQILDEWTNGSSSYEIINAGNQDSFPAYNGQQGKILKIE